MTAPAEAAVEVVEPPEPAAGEMRVRLPVVVIEGLDTSDGRFLTPEGLTHRALPLSLLACPENAHGGNDPDAAQVIGRIDTLTRTPGPELVSARTGQPFPEGTFVWSGEGAIDATHPIADLVRRRYLRGVSVDLAGMDVEMIGDDNALAEHPRRQMIAHSAEIAAVTLVPVPAFGDAYIELADEPGPAAVVPAEELPKGLVASAAPAWRSAEIGDYGSLTAAAGEGPVVVTRWPANAADALAEWIAEGEGEPRDAAELAAHIDAQVRANWMPDAEDDPDDELAVTAAAPVLDEPAPDVEAETVEDVGLPDAPQDCADDQSKPHPAAMSLLFDDGERYVATCPEHEDAARAQIAERGGEVTQVVQIDQPDTDAEENPA